MPLCLANGFFPAILKGMARIISIMIIIIIIVLPCLYICLLCIEKSALRCNLPASQILYSLDNWVTYFYIISLWMHVYARVYCIFIDVLRTQMTMAMTLTVWYVKRRKKNQKFKYCYGTKQNLDSVSCVPYERYHYYFWQSCMRFLWVLLHLSGCEVNSE